MQELCCKLLVGLCNAVLVFLARGVWVLGHDLFISQAGLSPPPGSLKGAGYGVQGGKDSHVIICSMGHNMSHFTDGLEDAVLQKNMYRPCAGLRLFDCHVIVQTAYLF